MAPVTAEAHAPYIRKGIHLLANILPLGLLAGEIGYRFFRAALPVLFFVALAVELLRSRSVGFRRWFHGLVGVWMKPEERRFRITGATWLLLSATLVAWTLPPDRAALAIFMASLADPVAAMVGMRWGRHPFLKKSLEGSLAFVVTGLAVALWFPDPAGSVKIMAVLVASVAEALSLPPDDNLWVPLLAGLVLGGVHL